MKKLLLLLVCLFLLASLSPAQQQPKVNFTQKIAEATPPHLPQTPVAKKLKSDAQDDNLKEKVKSIVEYSQDPGKARELSREAYYNQDGYLLKSVSYEEAYPSGVTVWGYIDGNRVTKSVRIEYAEGERPKSQIFSFTARAEDNALRPNAPRDLRYTIKHTYTYDDQGRLAEEDSYQNNGELWLRTTYTYNSNQREQRDYDARGNEMSRTVYILDKNGDTAEEWMFGADENDITKQFYTHVLDSKGNWIEEKVSERKKARGKTVTKLLWTTYRTITYYP
jgi:YD repeat-containing protein